MSNKTKVITCPNCGAKRTYVRFSYSRHPECGVCGNAIPIVIPKAVSDTAPDIVRDMARCPQCNHLQHYLKRGHKHIIKCQSCSHRFPVEMPKKIAECPECGRTYAYSVNKPPRCFECKTPFKKDTIHIGKQGRCKSIW